ncbi:MAG: 3'(2'),5'-bisphosphate nucleotidase CysQ [Pseudomonadota bacterium]
MSEPKSALPLADLQQTLVPIAVAAGAATIHHFSSGDLGIDTKNDDSPVTKADIDAEAIILAGLAKAYPDIPVVSEEAAAAGNAPDADALFFLVDPLDGTKEFISGNGEYTINIALIENGVPIAGVVLAPAKGRIFYGDREGGARQAAVTDQTVGDWDDLCIRPAPQDGITAIASRSHGSSETSAFLTKMGVENTVKAGSSLKFCLVACGEADLYPRFGRTMEWDTAAGDAVLRAAGGLVLCEDGEPLAYGKQQQATDSDFANPHFLAIGCGSLKDKISAAR